MNIKTTTTNLILKYCLINQNNVLPENNTFKPVYGITKPTKSTLTWHSKIKIHTFSGFM